MRKITLMVLIVFFIALYHGLPVYAEDSIDKQIANNSAAGIKSQINKDYEEAISYFTKAIELDPNNIGLLQRRTVCYYLLKNYDLALTDINAVLSLNPKDCLAIYNRACYYSLVNNQDAAFNSLQQVLFMEPRWKNSAILDSDFENIRNTERFRTLAGITVRIDGNVLISDTAPVSVDNRTLVPLRSIFEALGVKVEWDGETNTIYCNKDQTSITLQVDNRDAIINDKTITLDTPAKVINDRTYVPVRFVAESLGATVNWMDNTREVIITSPEDKAIIAPVEGEKIMERLKKALDYCPIDGAFVEPYRMSKTEGLAIFVAKSREDLLDFQSLPDENKKLLLNDYVQSHWGDFVGCEDVYIYLVYDGKKYTETAVGYQTQTSDMIICNYKQGIDTNVVIQDKTNDFYYDYYGNKKPVFNRANVKQETVSELIPHVIYFNDQLAGGISYPKTWNVLDQKQIVVFFAPPDVNDDIFADNINLHVNLIAKDIMGKMSGPDSFIEFMNHEAEKVLPDLKVETAKLDIKTDYGSGYEFIYTFRQGTAALKGHSYIFVYNNGATVYYELAAEEKNYDKYERIYEAMWKTLKLL